MNSSRWITQSVNNEGLEAVGIVYNWSNTVLSFKAICIQYGLLSAYLWGLGCALGFHYCKGLSISTKQHIVNIPHTSTVRHTSNFNLDTSLTWYYSTFFIQHLPLGFFQQQIYE